MPGNGQITKLAAILSQTGFEGRAFFCKPATDTGYAEWFRKFSMSYPGGVKNIYNTFETAEDACTSNNNDTIILGTHGEHAVSAEVAVDKNRMHIMSYDTLRGVTRKSVVQGAKITLAASVDAISAAYFSGVRQTVRGVKFISSSTQTTATSAARLGGEGLYVDSCSFQYNARLNQTTSWDVVCGTDTGEFRNCQFGNDAVLRAAANGNMLIDALGTPMKHTKFIDCDWVMSSSDADALHILVNDTAAINFKNDIYNGTFGAALVGSLSAIQLTIAVKSVTGLTQGDISFHNPSSNAASFSTTSDQFTVYGPEKPVAATTGIAVTPS